MNNSTIITYANVVNSNLSVPEWICVGALLTVISMTMFIYIFFFVIFLVDKKLSSDEFYIFIKTITFVQMIKLICLMAMIIQRYVVDNGVFLFMLFVDIFSDGSTLDLLVHVFISIDRFHALLFRRTFSRKATLTSVAGCFLVSLIFSFPILRGVDFFYSYIDTKVLIRSIFSFTCF